MNKKDSYIIGEIKTTMGTVPVVSTKLNLKDVLGSWKVRWGIGRMNYKINPGIYAIGNPNKSSPVLISANYKLTFDTLRRELLGINCWIIILDTKGVNVWCASAKGTFSTEELLNRIKETGISEIVSHRKLILPQLCASGVNSNEVLRNSGFSSLFGPVRASDIKQFIDSGYKATEEMRRVKFSAWERLVLTPVELVEASKLSLKIFGAMFLVNLIAKRPFGTLDFIAYAGAVFIGTTITPVLLPIVPGKAFAFKGWLLGLFWMMLFNWFSGLFTAENWLLSVGY
ncbi:MAG: mercury methylation corrinoid protein HgcA, partial [Oscillospiraceae bacterium]|nr:mercury methylation corrinoid protein HgcA [Oscillospiraceae bacterium]